MLDEDENELELELEDAGLMFRTEMATKNAFMGYWKHLLAVLTTSIGLPAARSQRLTVSEECNLRISLSRNAGQLSACVTGATTRLATTAGIIRRLLRCFMDPVSLFASLFFIRADRTAGSACKVDIKGSAAHHPG